MLLSLMANVSIWGSLIAPLTSSWGILRDAFRGTHVWDFDGCVPLEPSELDDLHKSKLRLDAARERMKNYMDNNSL